MAEPQIDLLVDPDEFDELVSIVAGSVESGSFRPDTILGLSIGGFPVAAALAKRLTIPSENVAGLPIVRDAAGHYHTSNLVQLASCRGRQVLIVDDSSRRGLLLRKVVVTVSDLGGVAKSCALIAWRDGLLPDYYGRTCDGAPPDFFWQR